jgi:hypothetical protein
MINLQFNYSIDYEVERIKNTISRLDWFKEKGYQLLFPEGFSVENKDFSDDNIKNSILEEYNEIDYKKVADIVNEQWSKFSPFLEKYFLETKTKLENIYKVNLTKYGVGGSYNLPNTIIVNFQGKFGIGVSKTIIHEIIHLSIQELIEKYKVGHWEKERVVDLILLKIVPEIAKMQNISIDTKLVDESFKKHYPNIEEIIKNL